MTHLATTLLSEGNSGPDRGCKWRTSRGMRKGGPGEAGTDWARGNPGQAAKVRSEERLPLTGTVQPGGQSQRPRFLDQRTTGSAPWRAPPALRWGSLAWRMLSQQDLSPGKTLPQLAERPCGGLAPPPWRGEGTLKGPWPYFPIWIMKPWTLLSA